MKPKDEHKFLIEVEEELETLIPSFIEHRKKDLSKMRRLFDNEDFESLRKLGHSLKGSCGGYGFDILSDLGEKLCSEALTENKESIVNTINLFSEVLENYEIKYI